MSPYCWKTHQSNLTVDGNINAVFIDKTPSVASLQGIAQEISKNATQQSITLVYVAAVFIHWVKCFLPVKLGNGYMH